MTPRDDAAARLDRYRHKRTPGSTPEPFGEAPAITGGNLFVFHKHHARNLHWDLRLELDGALESWAVPKGPSPNPADKRLAMHVEPHPLDYAEFEGVIPEGQYGAGPSIVWDKGIWIPKEDPHAGLAKGKLLFELRGFKVRGVFTLVHTPKAGESHWLLIKEPGDAYVDRDGGTEDYPDDSIYSGLEVDELPDASAHAEAVARAAAEAGAPARVVRPADVGVMKATAREDAFDDPDWVFEIKYDGYRLIAGRQDEASVALVSRNGNDLTDTFPDVARAVRGLPYDGLVLDGEVVVHDQAGLPSFGRLQKRGRLQNRADIDRATLELPATYYVFDLLAVGGRDLRDLPLLRRKALLREILPSVGPVRYSDHVAGEGRAVYRQMTETGLEGVVAKRASSPYRDGRSRDWYKIRTVRTDDFVVVGWTDPKGSRTGFGALHVGQYRAGPGAARSDASGRDAAPDPLELVWMGSVGTGFDEATIAELSARLEALGEGQDASPAVAPEGSRLPRGRAQHWVRPELVVEVRYREVTEAGVLRHPSFLRVREDKPPRECRLWGDEGGVAGTAPGGDVGGEGERLPEPKPVTGAERTVHFTNLGKVFWPAGSDDHGEYPERTKGDLIEYYRAVAPWLLPWLADRPLVLTRFPDGIHGKSFYQKDAPSWAPDWLRTVTVHSESGERDLSYFVADGEEALLYLANLGAVPLHVWHSRVGGGDEAADWSWPGDLDRPDWCLLDLDPKEAPFADVVEVALFLHDLCGDIGLEHYVKTSGSSGLHILIPLAGGMDYDQSRSLGELLARVAVKALPGIATVERVVRKREDKVYVDFLQNFRGQLVAAPFCARSKPWGTVSAPLRWKEVGPKLDLRDYTLSSMPRRMRALKEGDPLAPLRSGSPDLLGALERLQEKL